MVDPTQPAIPLIGVISFLYTNWKGETRRRRVSCKQVEYAFVPYRETWHFVLRAEDLEKGVDRSFIIAEITDLKGEPDDSI
jgi:hypothetical protein